jgi:cytochrome P450
MISREYIESFLIERAKRGPVFQTTHENQKFWYIGRGDHLRILTQPRGCPFRIINTELVNRLFRKPLFNLQEEEHKERRGLWKVALKDSNLKLLSRPIESETSRELGTWRRRIRPRQDIYRLMTSICASTILGIRSRSGHLLFRCLYNLFQKSLSNPETDSLRSKLSLLAGVLSGQCLRLMMRYQAWKLRLSRSPQTSLLGLVEMSGHCLSRGAINDDLLAILVAARDTTSSTLTWMVMELAKRPSLQLSLRAECHAHAISGPLSLHTIRALPRCQSFLFETLRLHSPNLFAMKQASEDVTFGEFRIATGERCAYSPLLEHFDAETFPLPFEFNPERFLCISKARSLLTFGTGAHSCIGKYLAQLILMTVLCKVVSKFELETPDHGWSDYTYSSLGKLPKHEKFICLKPI